MTPYHRICLDAVYLMYENLLSVRGPDGRLAPVIVVAAGFVFAFFSLYFSSFFSFFFP